MAGFFKLFKSFFSRKKKEVAFEESKLQKLRDKFTFDFLEPLPQAPRAATALAEEEEVFPQIDYPELLEDRLTKPVETEAPEEPPTPVSPEETDMFEGNWFQAVSSNVDEFRYIFDLHTLEVRFLSHYEGEKGSLYAYYDVPPYIYLEFRDTDSPGRFVWNHLRDQFPYKRLSSPQDTEFLGVPSKLKYRRAKPTVFRTLSKRELARDAQRIDSYKRRRDAISKWMGKHLMDRDRNFG